MAQEQPIDETKCPVCLDYFNEPKILPCFHTVCMSCLDKIKSSEGSADEQIVCSVCQERHNIPYGKGLAGFPDNLPISGLLEALRMCDKKAEEPQEDTATVVCGNGIDDNPATGYCFDCKVHLCDSCRELHKKMIASKDHHTSSLKEIKQGSATMPQAVPECKEHKGEFIKIYCSDCNDIICRDCAITSHRAHNFQYLAEASKTVNERLNSLLEELQKKDAEMEKHLNAVKKMIRSNLEQSNACQENIDDTCDALVELIEKQREESHQQLRRNMEVVQTQCRSSVQATELTLAKLAAASNFLERLQSCNDYVIVQSTRDDQLLDGAEMLSDFSVKKYAGTPLLVHNKPFNLDLQLFEKDLPKLGSLEPRDIHVYKPGSHVAEISVSLSGNITGGVVPLHMIQITMKAGSEAIKCEASDDYVRNYWKGKFRPLQGNQEYTVNVVVAGVEAPPYTFTFNPALKRRASIAS